MRPQYGKYGPGSLMRVKNIAIVIKCQGTSRSWKKGKRRRIEKKELLTCQFYFRRKQL